MTSRTELYKAHREGQEKHIYFLLAGAGAAIAFTITQTQTATLSNSKILLALSVVSWGCIFYCGCKLLLQSSNLLFQNYQFLRLQDGQIPGIPPEPQLVSEIYASLQHQADKSGGWGKWQFRLLIVGALFYIAWHIVEMYLRTSPLAA